MKIIAAIILAFALFPTISFASQETDKANTTATAPSSVQSGGGRVYVLNGSVSVTQGKNTEHRVVNNETIVSDTLINTGDKSAALLKFDDGQIVTMQSNSSFHVREYRYDAKQVEKSNIFFSMLKGGMRFITGLIGQNRKQAFKLSTPNATIGIRGTEFMVAMANNNIYSQVLTGNIDMTNAAGTSVVGTGQSAVVTSPSVLASLVSASAIPSGTFSELLSIPVQPSEIPASAPAAGSGAASSAAGVAAGAGAAAVAGASIIGAGGALLGSDSASIASSSKAAIPVTSTTEPAKAADKNELDINNKSGKGLTAKIGTLGVGAELNLGISDRLAARIGLNTFTHNYNTNESSVNYDIKLQLQSVNILADWYPFAGWFRTSAGLLYNNNKATLNGSPTSGSYTINGQTYLSTDVGSVQGTMTFNKVAPYLGIGWGNPVAKNKGWGLASDIGVLFQGKPKTSLTATCLTTCGSLQSDTAAENAKLQDDLSNFKWWPVVSVGISYQW